MGLTSGYVATPVFLFPQRFCAYAYNNSTVAVSYSDDHVENIINIPGSPEYIALMQYFTTHPNRLDPPPLDTIAQQLSFVRKALKPLTNLLLGRPGSPNAVTLSSMLTLLRSETESCLSTSISTIDIAFANTAFPSREEVNDALSYTGLKKLGKWQIPDGELNAAYGAYGFGLCSSYTDPYKCEEEEAAFGEGDVVLQLDYTSLTLSANAQWISTARSTYATRKFLDWKLGRNEATQWPEESDYWNTVKLRIHDLVTAAGRLYTQLLLTGDRSEDKTFLEVVKDALCGSELGDQVEVSKKKMDLIFVVARGAAEFQRRWQRGWLGCVQPKHCGETTIWGKARSKVQRVLEL